MLMPATLDCALAMHGAIMTLDEESIGSSSGAPRRHVKSQSLRMEGLRAREQQEPPMFGTAAMLISVISFAIPAIAQDKELRLPENTIDCNQFKKTGPQEWIEVGTAVFNLGKIKDIHLTDQPVTPGFFKFGGIDVYPVLDQKCGVFALERLAQGPASNTTAQASITLEQAPVPKTELEQDKSASTSNQPQTQL